MCDIMSGLLLRNSYGFVVLAFAPPKVTPPTLLLEMSLRVDFWGARDPLEHTTEAAASPVSSSISHTFSRAPNGHPRFPTSPGINLCFLEILHDIFSVPLVLSTRSMACKF